MTHHTEAEQPEALRVAAWLITAPQSTTIGDMLIAGRELRRLHARVQELEAAQANLTSALEDIASGEITRSHCIGPHCTEEIGVATADEMASRAAGALDWESRAHGITQEKQG